MGHELEIGQIVDGRFRISESLGAGSLGAVYKVVDQETRAYGVLKILPEVIAKRPALARRFLSAIDTFTDTDNRHIAKIIGSGADPRPYVVESFYEGLTLGQLLQLKASQNEPFSFEDFSPLIEAVGTGINYLHRRGEICGGVFPKHIFLAGDNVVISDTFLYAAIPPEALVRIFLRDEERARYLAPEFVVSPAEITQQADIYSIGVMLWEAMSGEVYGGDFKKIPAPEGIDGERLNRLLEKTLAESPEARFPSLTALALDLARVEGDENKVKTLEQIVMAEAREAAQGIRTPAPEDEQMGEATIAATLEELPEPAPSTAPVPDSAKPDTVRAEDKPKPKKSSPRKGQRPGSGRASNLFAEEEPPEVSGEVVVTAQPDPPEKHGNRNLLLGIAVGVLLLLVAIVALLPGGKDEKAAVSAPRTVVMKKERPRPFAKLAETARVVAEDEKAALPLALTAEAGWKVAEIAYSEGVSAAQAERYEEALRLFQASERAYRDLRDLVQQPKAVVAPPVEVAKKPAKPVKPKPSVKTPKKARKTPVAKAVAKVRKKGKEKKAAKTCPKGMVEIPAGIVLLGSPGSDFDRDNWEKENEKVSMDAFCIDTYEFPGKKGKRPRTGVNWTTAMRLCKKAGKRLCAEKEWERACKGPRNLKFPYGNAYNPNSCSTETGSGSDRSLSPAGKFGSCKSDFGIYDMSGNTMEWTSGRMDGSQDRVLKGGSSTRPGYSSRCASRYPAPQKASEKEFGFRCCTDYGK